MNFINSYKKLEQLCNTMFDSKHGISIYIDKLSKIDNKDKDLKKLKHCRYLRNKIVHEPNCTEEKMCKKEDLEFLNCFYKKINSKKDPLYMYKKGLKQKIINCMLIIILIIVFIILLKSIIN